MKLLIITKKTLTLLLLSCCIFVACDNGEAEREREKEKQRLLDEQKNIEETRKYWKEKDMKTENSETNKMILSHHISHSQYFKPIYHATIKNIYYKEITNIIFSFNLSGMGYRDNTSTNVSINIQPQGNAQVEFEVVLREYDKKDITSCGIQAIRFSDGSIEVPEATYNYKSINE